MSYLDDLKTLFGDDAPESQGGAPDATIPARTTLETARSQLEESQMSFVEHPDGRFTANGERRGCGYAAIEITVDEEAGTCLFDIDTGLRVKPENARPVRRMMRMLNSSLIQTGLVLADDGVVHFAPEDPIDVRGGDNIALAVGRGLSTIHGEAWRFTSIAAGVPAWELD